MGGHQKKKSSLSELPLFDTIQRAGGHIASFSTASSLSRQPLNGRNAYSALSPRSPSPPASHFYPPSNEIDEDAATNTHFAYSTTLRRHHPDGPLQLTHSRSGSLGRLADIRHALSSEGAVFWDRVVSTVTGQQSVEQHEDNGSLYTRQTLETPSSIYAHSSVEKTKDDFHTSTSVGLTSAAIPLLRETYGYNEFSVASPDPVLIKFAKTIYESPLILLLFGSAVISAVMGNLDDAISITIAILIVLTGAYVIPLLLKKC